MGDAPVGQLSLYDVDKELWQLLDLCDDDELENM